MVGMIEHILLGLAAGLIAWDVTRETIFLPLRDRLFFLRSRLHSISYRDSVRYEVIRPPAVVRWLIELVAGALECDFCFSHWTAAGVLLAFRPEPLVGSWFVSWLFVVCVAVTWTTFFRRFRGV